MKHTQGEWKRGSSWGGECVIKTNSVDICNVYDAEANANLIAAAPELLEALVSLYSKLRNEGLNASKHYSPIMELAKAAIKKAI